jgi:hypothetical protein
MGGGMSRQYRRFDDDEVGARRRSGLGVGTVVLATALGVGIGLLAAPETGTKTRRRLRQRISALGSDLGEGLEGVQEFGGRARERMRERLERLRAKEEDLDDVLEDEGEDEDSRALSTLLAVAAGVAATYFMSSERAAPARARARDAADTVRRQATDRWERFQHRTGPNGMQEGSQSETTGAPRASDEAPRGS